MTLPKAEYYSFRFLGTADTKQLELLSFMMKEYARQVLDYAAEKAKTEKSGNSGSWFDASVDRQSILKIKDEL